MEGEGLGDLVMYGDSGRQRIDTQGTLPDYNDSCSASNCSWNMNDERY